ncbi:MAG: hypothetical protein QOD71_2635 [Thermoleophilaceae bacterium]|nr:hypothetical protein [Thermoleophilaceae bacterium]
MNAFHVFGVLFAAWAVILSFVGITREEFPASAGAQRAVAVVSLLLAVATIGSAIYTSATEEHEPGGEKHAVLPGI